MSELQVSHVGEGKVYLIAGGGKIYTDIAARFVRSERPVETIVDSPYDAKLVENILSSGHLAATEFDYFIFGVEGYSRVTETQLVRKRIASYLIKSGRAELNGKRKYSLVYPEILEYIKPMSFTLEGSITDATLLVDANFMNKLNCAWYDHLLDQGAAEEDARYYKPQATEFKAIIGMNAHSIIEWTRIRCCKNAQTEIRHLATSMLKLCKEVAPDLFKYAGASCVGLKYCPENKYQHKDCKGKIPTHDEVKEMIKAYKKDK
jgi:thymidylate synthase (FAD)